MSDPFANSPGGQFIDCATNAFVITPNDGSDLTVFPRAIWVGAAGNLRVIPLNQADAVTITGVPAGTLLPLRVKRVLATSTTASSLVGFW